MRVAGVHEVEEGVGHMQHVVSRVAEIICRYREDIDLVRMYHKLGIVLGLMIQIILLNVLKKPISVRLLPI